jgi:hypothetical protein
MQATESQGGDKHKRNHHRSPAYPMLTLEQAVEKAKVIYSEDKRSFTSRPVIVKHLGYKDESSGVGNRELSALKQYGLLEEKGGEYRISETAYALLFLTETSEERRVALSKAALCPTIFKDLWTRYRLDASDGTLKDFLIHKKEFNPASVDQVVANYKLTIAFAKLTAVPYDEQEESDEAAEMILTATEREPNGPEALKEPVRPRLDKTGKEQPQISTPVGTDEGQVVFAHVRFDGALRKEYVASLKKYLDYLETTLQ